MRWILAFEWYQNCRLVLKLLDFRKITYLKAGHITYLFFLNYLPKTWDIEEKINIALKVSRSCLYITLNLINREDTTNYALLKTISPFCICAKLIKFLATLRFLYIFYIDNFFNWKLATEKTEVSGISYYLKNLNTLVANISFEEVQF